MTTRNTNPSSASPSPSSAASPAATSLAPSVTSSARLTGKVALVTGGSRGIGAAIVERLAGEGARVAFTFAGNQERADALVHRLVAAGNEALAIQADSADSAALQRAVDQTAQTYGRLDILVNNAAVIEAGPLVELTAEALDRMIAVNVRGPVVATQAALRHLGPGGRIINIGSVNAEFVPFPGIAIYALTKGAISGFTHGMARELGARGITINDVQPGPVDTDMNPATGPFSSALLPLIGVGRYGQTTEVAGLVAYLASAEAAYITGANLKIDGGFSA